MAEIKLLETWEPASGRVDTTENWYAEPFTKRTGCKVPGQCGGDCDCGCPYNTMTETERLPLIETIAKIFPNEWLAFIISPEEDDEFEPLHGKLIAHSSDPDQVYDAVNTILWYQHIYVFFNGEFEALKASYGRRWDRREEPAGQSNTAESVQAGIIETGLTPPPLPDNLSELIFSAVDQLYGNPNLNEAIRRLRLARVRSNTAADGRLKMLLDAALDQIEAPLPQIDELIWYLEDGLAELGLS